jgi:dGTPase
MLFERHHLESLEAQTLAPYALRSQSSRGRHHPEAEPAFRTAFQRDRDRILHTTAFRRLEYKTQVFVNYEGDYYRTRLTHTLEVSQIAQSLARALGANVDLAEAIALSHDLGHPPFGHAGESILDKLMADHGGFEHNIQSYRILTELEQRFPGWSGLNLCYETLEGVIKHETRNDKSRYLAPYDPHSRPSLEAQLANLADELAYNVHDLDDGLRAGLLQAEQLRGLGLWEKAAQAVKWGGQNLGEVDRHHIVREMIGLLVADVLAQTERNLQAHQVNSPAAIQALGENIVAYSPPMLGLVKEWKAFLFEHMYRHPRVVRMSRKAERFLGQLFEEYLREPAQLPHKTQAKIQEVGLPRAVTDYLAGMTDRYALQEWQRLFDPFERP